MVRVEEKTVIWGFCRQIVVSSMTTVLEIDNECYGTCQTSHTETIEITIIIIIIAVPFALSRLTGCGCCCPAVGSQIERLVLADLRRKSRKHPILNELDVRCLHLSRIC